jgi:glyoxylase-like metal-dependent hydrolase (beta-lactamase superfamily II)
VLWSAFDADEAGDAISIPRMVEDQAEALRARFSSATRTIPIAAHPETARRVAPEIRVDEAIVDGQLLGCGGRKLTAVFTPGHAPGHLVFLDGESRAMIAGDMVAGIGTILIDPVDGDLGQYLESLERMKGLSPSVLLPAHGPALSNTVQLLSFYVAHRHQRTEQIRAALDRLGAASAAELVPIVYPELADEVHPVARAQITSHLRFMVRHGLARPSAEDRFERA